MNEITAVDNIQENDIYIFAKIGNSSYAFPSLHVLEVLKLVELEYPEKMPFFVAGILEYKGKVIHIVDLRSVLKIETKEYDINTHILVMQGKEAVYGIIVDYVSDIKRIDTAMIAPPPYSTENCFTKGIYLNNGISTVVININLLEEWLKNAQTDSVSFNEKASSLLPRDIKSKETLHQRKMQLIAKTKAVAYQGLQNKNVYISFIIGSSTYCLEIDYVGGFYKYLETKVIKIPCTPDFIKGLISIKGDYITIIDLRKYFDNEFSKLTDKSTIIAIQSKDFKVGFIVDEISDTMNILPSELYANKTKGKNLKSDSKNEIIEYVKNDKLYLVLNIVEILGNEKLYVG